MNNLPAWNWAAAQVKAYRAQLRFCLRMTIAALLAFALTQLLVIPLHGLWAVLTAVVVTQISVGGSLRATAEYVIGTLGGAAHASLVGVLVPHTTPLALAGVLALAVVAGAAALNPSFRVAPFTAVIVLLISNELGEGPVESALHRLLEVALGGAVAVTVALLVFPERAYGLGLDAAARALDRLAQVLPELLAGFSRKLGLDEVRRIQDATGEAVARSQAIAAEAKRERFVNLGAEPDPGPLARTLLRLRHDLVIIGRAAVVPLPDGLLGRLGPPLARLGAGASDYLRGCATALLARRSPPPLDAITTALETYTMVGLRFGPVFLRDYLRGCAPRRRSMRSPLHLRLTPWLVSGSALFFCATIPSRPHANRYPERTLQHAVGHVTCGAPVIDGLRERWTTTRRAAAALSPPRSTPTV